MISPRWNYREDDADFYQQPDDIFHLMMPKQQQVLFENMARGVGGADMDVQKRHIANCLRADPAYSKGVAEALGVSLDDVS